MSPDHVRLILLIIILFGVNLLIFVVWCMMALSGQISEEERNRHPNP